MQAPELGLFDIHQIDPLDPDNHAAVYERRLAHLALADELGFAVAFTAERHFLVNYRCPSATAWIAAASQRTRRMRLGVLAYTLPIHAPVQLAEDVGMLDHLCQGRMEVGFGLGHREEELVALGVDVASKIPLFQQRLAIVKALWSGARVTTETKDDTVQALTINPLPLQQPHPPLWYAGTSEGAAEWAGVNGMNLAMGFAPYVRLQPAAAAFRMQQKRQEKENPDQPVGRMALMRHVYVSNNDLQAFDEMAADLMRLGEFQLAQGLRSAPVTLDEVETEAARLITEEVFIAGGPDTVAQSILTSQSALGFDLFLANPWGAAISDARVERTLRLLAGPVREALQGDVTPA